jgi:hypothetical protein
MIGAFEGLLWIIQAGFLFGLPKSISPAVGPPFFSKLAAHPKVVP